jgi:predicted dehydrogenase
LARSLPEIELIAVADPIAASRDAVAAENQIRAVGSHHELIGQIDAAVVVTTTSSHHAVAHELLSRGVHCLVEKPITLCATDADDLVAAADCSRCVLQVGHVERFNPAFLAGRPLVEQPQFIDAVRAAPFTGRSTDVSVVLDLMIHDIDLVLALAQSEVRCVEAIGGKIVGPNEDWAQAKISFASGAIASLFASRVHPHVQRTTQVIGRHGMLWLDYQAKTAKTMAVCERVRGASPSIPAVSDLPTAENNAILEELREFAAAIQSQTPVTADGRAGRAAVAVAEDILSSLATARAATYPPAIIPFMPFRVPVAPHQRKAA